MTDHLPAETSIDPTRESLRVFVERVPADTPIVMLNLLRFREVAAYRDAARAGAGAGGAAGEGEPSGGAAAGAEVSGRAAYERYIREATPFVAGVGGRVVWQGEAHGALIAPERERWDACLLIEYPSKAAFLGMVGDPGYQAIAVHRTAALADSRLVGMVSSG